MVRLLVYKQSNTCCGQVTCIQAAAGGEQVLIVNIFIYMVWFCTCLFYLHDAVLYMFVLSTWCGFVHICPLFHFQYMTLMKDGATMLWAERKDLVDSVDLMWNKYVQFLPEAIRPTVSLLFVCVCACARAFACLYVHMHACLCCASMRVCVCSLLS